MSCEYRVMVGGKYTIGLNETALGIVAPPWFQDTMRNTISPRTAELALTLGTLFSADEALKVGLTLGAGLDQGQVHPQAQRDGIENIFWDFKTSR